MQCRYLVTSYAVAASPPLNFATTSDAALLSANYGAAFALGRLIAIPASARFSSLSLMVVSVALSIASLWALVASPDSSSTLQVSTVPYHRTTLSAHAHARVCVCQLTTMIMRLPVLLLLLLLLHEYVQGASAALGLALASVFPSALNFAKATLGERMTGGMLSLLMLSGTAGGA